MKGPAMPLLSKEELELLAERKLLGTITPGEQAILDQWARQQPDEFMSWNSDDTGEAELKSRLLKKIREDAGLGERRSVVRLRAAAVAAAAVVVLVAGVLLLRQMQNEKFKMQNPSGAVVAHDVPAPERARAVI